MHLSYRHVGTGAQPITEDTVLNTLRGVGAREGDLSPCANPGSAGGRCIGTAQCPVAQPNCPPCDDPSRQDDPGLCNQGCIWEQSATCALTLPQFLDAYKALRNQVEPDFQINTFACVGNPGFVYLAGCVTAGR